MLIASRQVAAEKSVMNGGVTSTDWPELVFGLVGPIGVNMEIVERELAEALGAVGYTTNSLRLTKLMQAVAVEGCDIDESDKVAHYESRIKYANAVRTACADDAALAALAIAEIRRLRELHWKDRAEENVANIPVEKTAYILRQLKRAEEIKLLRKVYGRKFLQISVHASENDRIRNLSRSIALNSPLSPIYCDESAVNLVRIDRYERSDIHGQRIEEVFHLGDAFIDGRSEEAIERTIGRFIAALFGKNSVSPNRDEYGAYIAASAAIRSIDLARQVGAAIFSQQGEVITLGCNEVPKSTGGTYWTEDTDTHRDFDDGVDTNRTEKNRLIYDFLDNIQKIGGLREGLTAESFFQDQNFRTQIKNATVSDITEFGRMTHAEMTAICDAARLGKPTKGATIYVTTFPCHNCAKHIIACGIKRVVFIEPYPKSKALESHADSVILDQSDDKKVVFEHFIGISPRRYRDIFEKGSRRNPDGSLSEWYKGYPAPMLEDNSPYYVYNEESAVVSILENISWRLESNDDK